MATRLKTEIIAKIRANTGLKRALEDAFGKPNKPLSSRMLDYYLSSNSRRLTEVDILKTIGSWLKVDMEDLTDETVTA